MARQEGLRLYEDANETIGMRFEPASFSQATTGAIIEDVLEKRNPTRIHVIFEKADPLSIETDELEAIQRLPVHQKKGYARMLTTTVLGAKVVTIFRQIPKP